MKCEICHKAEAQVPVTIKVDGGEKELYVCKACAEKANRPPPGKPGKNAPHGVQFKAINGDGTDLPKPLVDGLVKATLDFMKGVAEVEETENKTCPACKATWEQIKESGRLGCPACWKTFAKQIQREFLQGEYAKRHVGAAPGVEKISNTADQRTILERDLKEAIAREDYRRAAALKRQLDDLDNAIGEVQA